MKPTKNRIYCKEIGRVKMLFKTQEKADNFIRFNSKDIQKEAGYSPQRSYFCQICGGWHITHYESHNNEKPSIVDNVLSTYRITYKSDIEAMEESEKALSLVKKLLNENDTEECHHFLEIAKEQLNRVREEGKQTNRYIQILHRYNSYTEKLERKMYVKEMNEGTSLSTVNIAIIKSEEADRMINDERINECEICIREIKDLVDEIETDENKIMINSKLCLLETKLNLKKGLDFVANMEHPSQKVLREAINYCLKTIELSCIYDKYHECVPLLQNAQKLFEIIQRTSTNEKTKETLKENIIHYVNHVSEKLLETQNR